MDTKHIDFAGKDIVEGNYAIMWQSRNGPGRYLFTKITKLLVRSNGTPAVQYEWVQPYSFSLRNSVLTGPVKSTTSSTILLDRFLQISLDNFPVNVQDFFKGQQKEQPKTLAQELIDES